MINNEIALNLVDTINHQLNDPPTMTIEAAKAFFPLLEQLTGKKVALLARRVIFYAPNLPTKYHSTNDAHAVLWHLVQQGK